MSDRNDLSTLDAAGIPAALTQFECGYWGRHEPPGINPAGTITFAVGVGYKSNKHLHGQNVYVLDVDEKGRRALVEMRKFGDLYGAGLWHYLIGVDDYGAYVKQVSRRIETIQEALDSLLPIDVRKARARGLEVLQQGDWFFIPASASWRPRFALHRPYNLDEGCIAEEACVGKTVLYVRGAVFHWRLPTLHLEGWYKARQDKSVHNGYLKRAAPSKERLERVRRLFQNYVATQRQNVAQEKAEALEIALEELGTAPEVLRGLGRLVAWASWSGVCLDCRYTWQSAGRPLRCPRCQSSNVVGRREPAPDGDSSTREARETALQLSRELHQAALAAWGGSPWESLPESLQQTLEGLRRLTLDAASVRSICLTCRQAWESPLRAWRCPFCGGEQIAERTSNDDGLNSR